MNMALRPGESIAWRWGHCNPLKYHGAPGCTPTYPYAVCNGLWEYRPDLTKDAWRKGATTVENVASGPDGLAAAEGKTGTIVWAMRSPYVFVGGRIEAQGPDATFFISADGKGWQKVAGGLDKFFPIVGPPRYEYHLKCELEGSARLARLAIVNDVQMSPLAMPDMAVGENAFTYSDQSTGDRKVRITHEWVERSASKPPQAPAAAVYPPEGGESDGTDVVFQWAPAAEAGGDAVADYQFELSGRQDMTLPLSMSFYKLISRTADVTKEKDSSTGKEKDVAKAQYTVPQPGLLTPDRLYYWHVRAMNDKGVWGPWSKTWSFTPRAAGCPVNVAVDYDETKGVGTLRWKAAPAGREPVKYRVYGSDEKGFSIADQEYQSTVGVTKEEMGAWSSRFPANFIAETTATELPVIGCQVDLPAANKAYYRVVAVDEKGKRSGSSDYAAAPRPVIYSKPPAAAKVGAEYRYQVCANRSVGDLSSRMKAGQQVNGYFDVEKPKFALAAGPAWLKIDQATGVLSGTPDAAGKADVEITVTIEREVRKLDDRTLSWGNEKILSTAAQRVGTATQKYAIDVR
jgi:hypothetical protein